MFSLNLTGIMDDPIDFNGIPAPTENVHPVGGDSSHITSDYGQVSPGPTYKPPSVVCPKCEKKCGRAQELQRHILSSHLPCWIHCPLSPCPWRGHRKEDFKAHLRVWHTVADPNDGPFASFVYDTNIVLELIKNGTSIDNAAGIALVLVSEKSHELGMVEEWEDLWGRQPKGQRRGGVV
ncbi:hypothetical protein BC827DRAFT_327650 [Russula dissimulans]|nr:hypothetical protein BC827DRAFT_327650 [Russula dissimulans]